MNAKPITRFVPCHRMGCFILCCLCLLLVQCVNMTDPGYERLAAAASTNPPKNAIVGMWHRKDELYLSVATRWSWLFQGDGTGVFRGALKGAGAGVDNTSQSTFTWRYEGNGVWTMHSPNDSSRTEGRISGEQLLLSYAGPLGPQNYICTRVE